MVRQLLMASVALLVGLGCQDRTGGSNSTGAPAAPPSAWRVGAFLSLSGEDAAFGIYTREGIDLAVDEVNKAGGVKGRPIKVLYEDDRSNPNEATNKVLQLIDRDKVVALLGEVASSRSKAGGIVANRKKVPMISPSSTNADVTRVGPFVFRVCFTDDVQGRAAAQFLTEKLNKRRVGLLFASDDLYSSGLAEEFKKELHRRGGEIVAEKSFLKKETNFTTYITELKDHHPDIIYAPIYYNQMMQLARHAKAAGLSGQMFLGSDGWDATELLTDAGEELEGAFLTDFTAPDVPWDNAKAFRTKYAERYQRDPSSLAAQGYDAAKLLADAMGRAEDGTPEAVRKAIQATKGFAGATGVTTINSERNADKAVIVAQIHGKRFNYYSTVYESHAPAEPPH